MKKLILLLLFIPLVSCQDVEVRKTYYDSGELKSTENYVDDVRQGESKFYYDSGELKSTVNYVDGLLQGEWKSYFESGELESTVNYVDGLKQGEWKSYFESGELRSTVNYVDDVRQGESKFYYDSGELASTGNYVDGLLQGEYKAYFRSGKLKSTVNYVDDVRQGEYKFYYDPGEYGQTANKEKNLKTPVEYFNSGIKKHKNGDFYGAIEDYNKIIEILMSYDTSASSSDAQTKAVALDFLNASLNFGSFQGVLYRRGISKSALKDYDGGITDFNMAIALDSDFASAYFARGIAKFVKGDKKIACEDARKAQSLGFNNAPALTNLLNLACK